MEYLKFATKMVSVQAFEDDAERHMRNAQNDCSFHFVTIVKAYVICRVHPCGVEAEWVDAVLGDCVWFCVGLLVLELVDCVAAASEKLEGYAHEIIIDNTHIRSEEAHQQN